ATLTAHQVRNELPLALRTILPTDDHCERHLARPPTRPPAQNPSQMLIVLAGCKVSEHGAAGLACTCLSDVSNAQAGTVGCYVSPVSVPIANEYVVLPERPFDLTRGGADDHQSHGGSHW